MRAILFPARDRVVLDDLPDPRPGPGEVTVQIRASGLCHTDIEVMRGNYGSSAFPVVPGHEFAGVITEVGAGAGWQPGARVVVDPNLGCGQCRPCRQGQAHLCTRLGAYGVTVNGGFAERVVVRAGACHAIGDLPFDLAALAEPMGCVLNGVGALRLERAETALVLGAGPIGMLMAWALRGRGVPEVTLVERDPNRRALAESLGFGTLPAEDAALAPRLGAMDVAVDATGVPAVAARLADFLAPGGSALFFGVCPADARIEIAPFALFRRQLTLAGTHSLNHNIPEALAAIAAAGPELGQLVTHRLGLEAMARVFAEGPPPGALKVQFSP